MNNLNNLSFGEFLVGGEVLQFDDLELVELSISTKQKLQDIETVLEDYRYAVDHKTCGTPHSVVVWLESMEYAVWSVGSSEGGLENEVDLNTLRGILIHQKYKEICNG